VNEPRHEPLSETKAEAIRVRGVVQGVGFRPTVWRLASNHQLRGRVWNDAEGVLIHAWGSAAALDDFVRALHEQPPPLAHIEAVERSPLAETDAPDDFTIVASSGGKVQTAVSADAATCPDCLAELNNPNNRRYRYPFINCTHCGPRLSIVSAVPYDRANTSMAGFTQCPSCDAEYHDPADRRFHAQPNACPECGPKAWLEDGAGNTVDVPDSLDAVDGAARLLAAGHILAVKGIGGFHLACDAGNEAAVAELRRRKGRYHKPLALMARDLDMVRRYAELGPLEESLLQDRAAPIVVLTANGEALARSLAPGQSSLGFMLPYSPLHHLLLRDLERPIVLTSGNPSGEPQCIDNDTARSKLAGIADYWLLHDRDIVNRLDDSVVRVMEDRPMLLRRSRGYAPGALRLAPGFEQAPPVLAMGAELKNTFCLLEHGRALLSQHMGDLENAASLDDYRHNLALYRQLFDQQPAIIAVDAHPDYLSSQLGRAMADELGCQLVTVSHHHAHIAAVMAEQGLPPDHGPVLGLALDGLGLGVDGSLWGGELLLADYRGSRRLAHFQPVPLLGGMRAMQQPWRNTLAQLLQLDDWDRLAVDYGELDILRFLHTQPLADLARMAQRGINSPPSSSCGRLFDAVAAALGLCREQQGYEGQAAMELESLAAPYMAGEGGNGYPCGYQSGEPGVLRWQSLWRGLLDDLKRGVQLGVIAARFHHGLAQALERLVREAADTHGIDEVVFGGGVFQNRLLLEALAGRLRGAGLRVRYPQRIPVNDGGLSLGQVVIAAVGLM
jgi:hydrogenase maturation protein HypF